MSAESKVVNAAKGDDGLRIRVRISEHELLFQPLQACATSKERTRLLLSLALQGYLLQAGAIQGGGRTLALPPLPERMVPAAESKPVSPGSSAEVSEAGSQVSVPLGPTPVPPASPVSQFSAALGGFLSDELFSRGVK